MKKKSMFVVLTILSSVYFGSTVVFADETNQTTVSGNLEIFIPSLSYSSPSSGTLNLWAELSFSGQNSDGKFTWTLKDFGNVETIPVSCLDAQSKGINNRDGNTGDGFYKIKPDGAEGNLEPFYVYCDMTTQGGGWTLYANHAHNVGGLVEVDEVKPQQLEYGVMKNPNWRAVRDGMTTGMMFVDEAGRVSLISASKLETGRCIPIKEIFSLKQLGLRGYLWQAENSGCTAENLDYSLIVLADSKNENYKFAGAALYQYSTVKFDMWPYQNPGISYNEHNSLLYFIK